MFYLTTLKNGLRVITAPMREANSIGISVLVGAGSRYETPEINGISHFLEHIFLKGTRKRPTQRDLTIAIEGIGGIINGYTNRESTSYWIKIPKEHFEEGLDVVLDMVLHSRLEKNSLERERGVIIQEINRRYDSPENYVWKLYDRIVWKNTPLSQSVLGSKENIKTLPRRAFIQYINDLYVPENMVVSIAGNLEHKKAVSLVRKLFDKRKGKQAFSYSPFKEEQKTPRLTVNFRKTEQIHLILGIKGLYNFHPDRFVLWVINSILGIGFSSRLFQNIRESKGLAYGIDSYVYLLQDTGNLAVWAGIKKDKLGLVIKEILAEMRKLKTEKVSAEELKKAKEKQKGRFLFKIETSENRADWYGCQLLLTPKVLTPERVIGAIDKVSAEDIQSVAQQLFVDECLNLAVIGPVKDKEEIKELLTF